MIIFGKSPCKRSFPCIMKLQYRQEQHVRKYFYKKSVEFGIPLKYSATRYKQNYQIINLVKISFLVLISRKRRKRDKSEFVNKFAKIIVTIIFI